MYCICYACRTSVRCANDWLVELAIHAFVVYSHILLVSVVAGGGDVATIVMLLRHIVKLAIIECIVDIL